MSRRGRPKKIGEAEKKVLCQIVAERPLATTAEVGTEFKARTGIAAHTATIRAGLREAGVVRKQGDVAVRAEASGLAVSYGYRGEHRRHTPQQRYPSCLTDAEWALVADLFANQDGRGSPPRYSRRAVVDACCYVVRTGCSWRMLPREFPPWKNVYRTFRRWADEGRFEAMRDRLRAQWREREGRTVTPSAEVFGCAIQPHVAAGWAQRL
jgi:transposase